MAATVTVGDSRSSNVPQEPDSSRPTIVAGVLLFAGVATVLMGIITAEALYPAAYNTHTQSVSDLTAMRPNNIVRQPSADIFNLTMIFAGPAIGIAAYFLFRAGNARRTTVPLAVLGLGVIGVGIFPGNHLALHTLFFQHRVHRRRHRGHPHRQNAYRCATAVAHRPRCHLAGVVGFRRSLVRGLDACGTAR